MAKFAKKGGALMTRDPAHSFRPSPPAESVANTQLIAKFGPGHSGSWFH
jgi:hypothetical protein